ncbi:unnamed protein product [Ectocarpus sp. 4 AP-2014]
MVVRTVTRGASYACPRTRNRGSKIIGIVGDERHHFRAKLGRYRSVGYQGTTAATGKKKNAFLVTIFVVHGPVSNIIPGTTPSLQETSPTQRLINCRLIYFDQSLT